MQASKKLRHIQWISIFFLMLAGCISDLDRRVLSIAKCAIRGEIEVSAAQMGLPLSTFSMAYELKQLSIGVRTDIFVVSGAISSSTAPPLLTAPILTIG
ncbi:hypothetical protein KDX09_30920 [Burkholderia cenocepacia]|uniref:hypothetical protein n=1 Tax=Burkholderia cenocepacia TaxID=95486 RepID=UPI001B990257|nr:hypothetical protein [Burkholderia cenocepacia]MBR8093780.1 hypothetical protein [Burkholderia cenocepacia]UJH76178.1 hypothetical protein L0U95_30280 [Burkholderia cenocepacia]